MNNIAKMKRIRVLVVDDHPVLRRIIGNVLKKYPDLNLVGEADNGREALRKALELQPDVVLMDVNMPVMNGIEATQLIEKAAPRIHIIGLSMHEDDDTAATMKFVGASEYLIKTSPAEQVIAVILNLCSQW